MLSRTQCSALRAIAIIGIMLHNYCHWLGPAVKENEYTFTRNKSVQFFRHISEMDWTWLPIDVASFFGHYGVPMFLFLSAYGLVMKYEQADKVPSAQLSAWQFINKHFAKLFDMMIFGYAAFLIVDFITPGTHHYQATDIVAQLLMVNNLLPHPDKIIWPGPYWFFGLMLQLYVVYRLVLYRRSSWWGVALVALCWVVQSLCHPESEMLNRLRYNCIGAMLPFVAGMIYARAAKSDRWAVLTNEGATLRVRMWLVAVATMSAVIIVAGSTAFAAWLWVPLFVCTLWVALVRLMPQWMLQPLSWIGGLSAAVFVWHPLVRKVFIPLSRHGDVYAGLTIYIMCTFVVAYVYNEWRKRRA